jgi:hypothetical protein
MTFVAQVLMIREKEETAKQRDKVLQLGAQGISGPTLQHCKPSEVTATTSTTTTTAAAANERHS